MVSSPFPAYVGYSCMKAGSCGDYTLSSEEARILSPNARAKRRNEFLLGRAAAHKALRQVGFFSPPSVLKGRYNEPLWPKGFVGSITHTSEWAICAVCPMTRAGGIGVDLEEQGGDVPGDIWHLICSPNELEWVNQEREISKMRILMIFSAKEAAFKAFFSRVGNYLDFLDACLVWDQARGCFKGRLLRKLGSSYAQDYTFEVACRLEGNNIFSYILLPPLKRS